MLVAVQSLLEDAAALIIGLAFRNLPDSFPQFGIGYPCFASRLGKPAGFKSRSAMPLSSTRCYVSQVDSYDESRS
ncbi:hypothetical protein [Rhizobium leguminosarum]|uniref:hypothetical protein n=1 Tax=Rhizobium leguminosarum TaxID=384 RepID=UPI0028C48640|nr:hypothetical protein [Rhizobium leguminosarum]